MVAATPLLEAEVPARGIRKVRASGSSRVEFAQRAVDRLDYFADFAPILEYGETIAAATATVEVPAVSPELQIERAEFSKRGVLVWVIGGADAVRYTVRVDIATSAGETRVLRFDIITSGTATLIGIKAETSGVAVPGTDPATVLTMDKAYLQFTGAAVNGETAPQAVILTNTGPTGLAIADIDAGDYYGVSHNCPATLLAGGFCTIQVTAKPKVSGLQGGSLQVTGAQNKAIPLITTTA